MLLCNYKHSLKKRVRFQKGLTITCANIKGEFCFLLHIVYGGSLSLYSSRGECDADGVRGSMRGMVGHPFSAGI